MIVSHSYIQMARRTFGGGGVQEFSGQSSAHAVWGTKANYPTDHLCLYLLDSALVGYQYARVPSLVCSLVPNPKRHERVIVQEHQSVGMQY